MERMEDQTWYKSLTDEGKYVARMITKYHNYFSQKDKKYKRIVQVFKILTLLLAMISTIVLGLKNVLSDNYQINIGLILAAVITFLTAFSSFFNFEKYWMRNI